jgi:uncharacterized protein (TIGR03086 family)
MGATEALERAIATAKQVLANVSKEDLTKSTPCASWNVGQLINHMVGANYFFIAAMGDASPSDDDGSVDFAAGDYNAALDEGAAACLATFSAPGALDKTANAPWGQVPAQAFMGMAANDLFTHAWDLARATGQSTDLDPELAAQLHAGAKASISDAFRGSDGGPNQDQGAPFGPQQQAPEGACNADKLAAFMGRAV